jgi:phage-related protein
MTLPTNLIQEKNKLVSTHPWVYLLTVNLGGGDIFKITNNNEDVVFQSQTYTAISIKISPIDSNSDGELSHVNLSISNVDRIMQPYLEEHDGGIDAEVNLKIVDLEQLTEDYTELSMDFIILGTSATEEWVNFTLGAAITIRKPFPPNTYISNHCMFQPNSPECGATIDVTTCKRTINDCRGFNNSARFGGFLGLGKGNARLV